MASQHRSAPHSKCHHVGRCCHVNVFFDSSVECGCILFQIPVASVMHRPKKPLIVLDFFHFWKPFLTVFQSVGISHYSLMRPALKNQHLKRNLLRLHAVLIFLIQILICVYFLKWKLHAKVLTLQKFLVSPIFEVVNYGTRFSLVLSYLVIPFETFFKRHTEQTILDTFQRIDDVFKKNLKYPIDYAAHRRRQLKRMWTSFVGLAILVTANVSLMLSFHSEYFTQLPFNFIFIMSRMRIFQIAFYINELVDLLNDLKMSMRRQQLRMKYNSAGWKDIQYARKVYSNIWLLKTLIGECFGYSMILLVSDFIVKMLNGAYWFYLASESMKSDLLNMR